MRLLTGYSDNNLHQQKASVWRHSVTPDTYKQIKELSTDYATFHFLDASQDRLVLHLSSHSPGTVAAFMALRVSKVIDPYYNDA